MIQFTISNTSVPALASLVWVYASALCYARQPRSPPLRSFLAPRRSATPQDYARRRFRSVRSLRAPRRFAPIAQSLLPDPHRLLSSVPILAFNASTCRPHVLRFATSAMAPASTQLTVHIESRCSSTLKACSAAYAPR
jgi:hypothetical protein